MKTLTLDYKTLWALSTTGIALVLLGMLLGKSMGSKVDTVPYVSSTEPGAPIATDPYEVPTWLLDAPMEWHSEVDQQATGVAIRLDYQRRELLIDECQHSGFFDRQKNRPREQSGLRCARVLTGTLIEFGDSEVLVQTRQGEEQRVGLRPVNEEDRARLEITLDGVSVKLIPGQTNDLNQSIERLAHMVEERELLASFMLQAEQQQRALMAQANGTDRVPRFSLPASVVKEHDAIRAADAMREQATD